MQVGVLMQHVFQVTPAFTDLVHSTPSCIGIHPMLDGREREPVVKPAVQRARASLRVPGLHLRERPVALGRRSDNVPLRRMEPLRRLRRRGGEGGDEEDCQPLQRECVPHRPGALAAGQQPHDPHVDTFVERARTPTPTTGEAGPVTATFSSKKRRTDE